MAILLKKPKWFNYCINSRILNPIYAVGFIPIRRTLTNHIQKNSQHFICRRNHQAGMTTGIVKKFLPTHSYEVNKTFFLTQHKPHLGLPRTWIIHHRVLSYHLP